MKNLVLTLFLFLISFFSFSTTYYSRQTGNWDINTSWNTDVLGAGGTQATAGNWPGSAAGDIAIIGDGGAAGVITISYPTNTANSISTITLQDDAVLNFGTATRTLATTSDFTMSGTSSITGGATARILNVGGSFIVSAGATCDIGRIQMGVTGTTSISGRITFSTSNGFTKTFTGDVTINSGGIIDFTITQTLTLTNALIMNGTAVIGSASTSATGVINVGTTFTVSAAATASIGRSTLSIGTTSDINGTLKFATNTSGTKIFTGTVTVAAAGKIAFDVATTLAMSANLSTNPGAIIGGGAATGIINVTQDLSLITGGATNLQGITINITRDFLCPGTAVLDAATGTNLISIAGNWNITSSAANPFVEGTASTVTFNGTSGTQTISNPLGTETFNNLAITNTSATVPGVQTNVHLNINNDFDHTSTCTVDLKGKNIVLISSQISTVTCNFTSGVMMTSVAGSSFTITDPNTLSEVDWLNYRTGDATNGVPITLTIKGATWIGSTFYGTTDFTKTGSNTQVMTGGNIFYGPCTFTTLAAASRWRMGDNVVTPDIFYNGTFVHNGSANFVIGANSVGNEFYGTTTLTSTSSGGMYICRANGTNTTASSTFHGPVVINVSLTGNVIIAEGIAVGTYTHSATFESTIQLNSAASSTGDIYIGQYVGGTITLATNTGQFIPGSLLGRTSIYLYNVSQNGNALTQTISGASTSKIYCGSATPLLCTFNANTVFTGDSVSIKYTTFNGNATITGNNQLTTAYSNYNGTTNTLQQNGTVNSASTGGNVTAAGTTTTIINNGTGYLRLGNSVGDDFNGDVVFQQLSSGALAPAYNTTSTFAGNISTTGTTTAITFASAASGRVTIDGNSAQAFNGASAQAPVVKRLTMSTSAGAALTLNVPVNVSTDLTMMTGNINLNGNTLTLGTGTGATGTLNYSAGFLYGITGTFTRWINSTSAAMGAIASNTLGHFPMGTSTGDYRPLWLTYTSNLTAGGTVSVLHDGTTLTTAASHTDATWSGGTVVDAVTNSFWTLSVANGFALNGSTGSIRYGGTGYGTNTLTDLDATLAASAPGTFAAATSVNTTIEANRTGLSTSGATFANSWRIGTKDISQSPLPIQLLLFDAERNENKVNLNWITATEINNDFFTVEKSQDGNNFTFVSIIKGAGNSTSILNYSSVDDNPYHGISYYRLKQTDFDGKYSYSNIVAVEFNKANDFNLKVFPNPSTEGGHINLSFTANKGEEILVVVYDATGKKDFSKIIITQTDGDDVYAIDESHKLTSGIYFITATSNQIIYSKKLIVK